MLLPSIKATEITAGQHSNLSENQIQMDAVILLIRDASDFVTCFYRKNGFVWLCSVMQNNSVMPQQKMKLLYGLCVSLIAPVMTVVSGSILSFNATDCERVSGPVPLPLKQTWTLEVRLDVLSIRCFVEAPGFCWYQFKLLGLIVVLALQVIVTFSP